MQRDKMYGALIFLIGLIALVYLSIAYLTQIITLGGLRYVPIWSSFIFTWTGGIPPFTGFVPHWAYLVILPMWIVVLLILAIAMWIGWTMMTTPPPVPLEELEELGLEDEEEEKK